MGVVMCVGVCPVAGRADVRIVTWNLEWFPGRAPGATPEAQSNHVAAVQAALAELNPDVVLFQEVRDWNAAQLAVARLPGFQVNVCSAFGGKQEQAIASRLRPDSAWAAKWRQTDAKAPRGYAFAALQGNGRLLLFYSVHLKSNRGGKPAINIAKRTEAADQLVAHLGAMRDLYGARGPVGVTVGGDFNTDQDDQRFATERTLPAMLAAGLTWCFDAVPRPLRLTKPAEGSYPAITFDHLFTQNLAVTSVQVVTNYPSASDHRPVLLTVASHKRR
jgi:endonuclease/exonuclease/phosphatase family metal-dependent hydrolase